MNKFPVAFTFVCAALVLPLTAIDLVHAHDDSAMPTTSGLKKSIARILLTDDSFVHKATLDNLSDVELANLALNKSDDASIQKFAQQLLRDHTAAAAELKTLATRKRIDIPTELDREHKNASEKLTTLEGVEFDRAFSAQMQKDHDKAVSLFAAAAEDRSLDDDLKTYAGKRLPMLRDYQRMAHRLKDARTAAN